MTEYTEQLTRHRLAYLAIGVALAASVWLLRIPGLPTAGGRALSLLVLASVLWLGGVGTLGTVSLLAISLAVAFGVATPPVAFSGFTNDVTWLIVGSFFIAAAVSKVGLDKRIAYAFMKTSSGSYLRLTLAIWGAAAVLGVAIPSAIARMAVFLPISQGMMVLLDAKPGSRLAANLEWTFVYAVTGAAIFSFPSMVPMVVSLGVLTAQYGITVSYSQYLIENTMPSLVYFVIMFLSIHLIFRAGTERSAEHYRDFVERKYLELGKVKPEEWKTLLWLLITISAWVVGGFSGISTGTVALLCGSLLFTPRLGLLEAKDMAKINWDIAIFIGGVLGIASITIYTGLTGYLESALIGPMVSIFAGSMGKYLGYAVGAQFFMVIATFAIPGNIAATAVFSPPLLVYAQSVGVNLRFAAYTNGLGWLLTGFFPYQQLLVLLIWPLGGVRSFAECAKHSTLLFLPRVLILILVAISWMFVMHLF